MLGSDPISAESLQKMKYEDFQIIKTLGYGAFGKVELGKLKNKLYALKIISKNKLAKQGKEYQAFVQRQLLIKLKHPGIPIFYTCFQDQKNLYFVIEYCEGGNLKSFIHQNFTCITQELRKFYVAELVKILQYLQEVWVVHRDFKPENIFLSQLRHLKLGDFGTAQFQHCKIVSDRFKERINKQKNNSVYLEPMITKLEEISAKKKQKDQKLTEEIEQKKQNQQSIFDDTFNTLNFQQLLSVNKRRKATFVGTCYYVSPQLLEAEECGFASDIWALGCTIYELYYGVTPFDGESQYEIFENIKSAKIQFPENGIITEQAKDLIQRLLQKNPEDRLGCNSRQGQMFSDLLKHEYFANLNQLLNSNNTIFLKDVPKMSKQHPFFNEELFNEKLSSFCKSKTSESMMSEYIKELDQSQNIIFQGTIQKRTFITYNQYYLALMKDLTLYRIKVTEPEKRRIIKIPIDLSIYSEPAELLEDDFFKLISEDKIYKFKTKQAKKWVEIINSVFMELKTQNKLEKSQINNQQRKKTTVLDQIIEEIKKFKNQ